MKVVDIDDYQPKPDQPLRRRYIARPGNEFCRRRDISGIFNLRRFANILKVPK